VSSLDYITVLLHATLNRNLRLIDVKNTDLHKRNMNDNIRRAIKSYTSIEIKLVKLTNTRK